MNNLIYVSTKWINSWSLTLANLRNDSRFISKEFIGMRPFGELQNTALRARQYYTIVEVCDS